MLPALFDDDRRSLARLAGMMAFGALAVLPLTAQPSFVASATAEPQPLKEDALLPPARVSFPDYAVQRDPFVAPRADLSDPLLQSAGSRGASLPIVRAIILGTPARALIEVGGTMRVVGVGDRLGESAIVRIDADAVTLADGTHLALSVAKQ